MTVPSVSMKSALGMAHPSPAARGDLALSPGHVTLRHLSLLLIALATARARPSRAARSAPGSLAGSLASLPALQRSLAADVRERAPPVPVESSQHRRKISDPPGSHCPGAS